MEVSLSDTYAPEATYRFTVKITPKRIDPEPATISNSPSVVVGSVSTFGGVGSVATQKKDKKKLELKGTFSILRI